MFAANFYASCFDIRGKSIGKKLNRLDWEKAVYRPLFTLANTLRLGYLKLYNLQTFSTIAYLVFALKFLYLRLAYQRGFCKSRDHRVYGL